MERQPGRSLPVGVVLTDGSGARPTAPLAVVIPNLDGAHWLGPCLASLQANTLAPREIIVCDDGSRDDSAAVTVANNARFLDTPLAPRSGFAATVNRGLAVVDSATRWVLVLNNDTVADETLVAELMAAANAHPEASVIAPLVLSLSDPSRIDSAGLLLYPDGVARPRWHGRAISAVVLQDETVLLASGTAMAIHRDALARFGGFDESLGSYVEDVNWCLASARRGAVIHFAPGARVAHAFSATGGALSPTKARLVERNRIVVAVRHLPLRMLGASPLWTLRRWAVLARTVRGAQTPEAAGRAEIAFALVAGVASGVAAVPRALRERRDLTRSGSAAGRHWRERLTRHRCGPDAFRTFGAPARTDS